jgi:hypothetical protein
MSIFSRLTSIGISLIAIFGCDRTPSTAMRRSQASEAPVPRQYVVAKDPAGRDAQERDATKRLLGMLREPMRSNVKGHLESSDWNTQTAITSIAGNPAATEVLEEIYAIKDARLRDSLRAGHRELAHIVVAPVTVGIWTPPKGAKYTSLVERTPGGLGRNLVLLSPDDIDVDRLAQAFRILSRSRTRDGEFTTSLVRQYIRGKAPKATKAEIDIVRPIILKLRSAKSSPLDGYGTLQSIETRVGPVARGSE